MESNINMLPEFADLGHLSAEKLQQLDTVLKSILALPGAQDTYTHIIDGKPTWESNTNSNTEGPLRPSHKARQQYEEFRKVFNAQALKLDTQVRCLYTLIDHILNSI